VVTWTIGGDPTDAPWEDRDAFGWDWPIDRDGDERTVQVIVTRPAKVAAEPGGQHDAAKAIETKGRRTVESVLDRDNPPSRITFTTNARVKA
jgi:hypothetical protein